MRSKIHMHMRFHKMSDSSPAPRKPCLAMMDAGR
jgi:hypothetical protein